jgi:dimethylargininase
MRLAITREVSAAIERCELTLLAREPIDLLTARRQHETYERTLRDVGCSVVRLAADDEIPDSVFIEDIAVVFPALAIITRPGAESRRRETAPVAEALARYRPLVYIEPPGTLDGGDVLVAGTRVFVGETPRTNAAAIAQMGRHLVPHGYTVHTVPVRGCLHLKSAVTAVADDTLLINREWVAAERFRPLQLLDVDPSEPHGANAVRVDDALIYPTAFPRTRARLDARRLQVTGVDVSELAKAEGAVTCCSLIFDVNW